MKYSPVADLEGDEIVAEILARFDHGDDRAEVQDMEDGDELE